MKTLVSMLAAISVALPLQAIATPGSAQNVRIAKVAAPASAAVAFVYFDGTHTPGTACALASSGARMAINLSTPQGQAQLSIALQAMATGVRVNAVGSDTCSAPFQTIEVLNWLETI